MLRTSICEAYAITLLSVFTQSTVGNIVRVVNYIVRICVCFRQLSRCSDGLRAWRPRYFSWQEQWIFFPSLWSPDRLLKQPSPLSSGYWGWFPGRLSGWGVKLSTRLHLMPRSRIVELYPHSPPSVRGIVRNKLSTVITLPLACKWRFCYHRCRRRDLYTFRLREDVRPLSQVSCIRYHCVIINSLKRNCSICVPSDLTFKHCTLAIEWGLFCKILGINSDYFYWRATNQLTFVMEMQYVICEAGTEFLKICHAREGCKCPDSSQLSSRWN
jgi:hypothetical protein